MKMRKIIGLILMLVIILAVAATLVKIPFGAPKTKVGSYYIENGTRQTGAANIVTSVVLNYRGFDTLGEVTVLFIAALGLGAITFTFNKRDRKGSLTPSSLVLKTGCKFLFPLILLFGTYIFIHGHLTPGGGFQGGAIIASAYVLIYLSCREKEVKRNRLITIESIGGLIFVGIGIMGLLFGGYFLFNFLPKGVLNTLFSAGIIPVLYVAIGFKVGSELAGIIVDFITS